jgi:hypothetical protein
VEIVQQEPIICFGCGSMMTPQMIECGAICPSCGLRLRLDEFDVVHLNRIPRLYPAYEHLADMPDSDVYAYLAYRLSMLTAYCRLRRFCGRISHVELQASISTLTSDWIAEVARQRKLRAGRGLKGLLRRIFGYTTE